MFYPSLLKDYLILKTAKNVFKMRQNESVIMRTYFKLVVFSDLNCYHSSVLIY